MKIYVAASFAYADRSKTEERKKQIQKVVNQIKPLLPFLNVEWYLPQELEIPNAWDISLEEWSEKVYRFDVEQLTTSEIVLFISFGKENNAGAVWEMGYAIGYNHWVENLPLLLAPFSRKKIICIKMTDEAESLMVSQSADIIITKEEIETYDWVNMPYYKTRLDKLS